MRGLGRCALPCAIALISFASTTGILAGSPAGAATCSINVGNGAVGSYATIQAGIDAATSPGQTICVYPGLYNTDHASARDPLTGGSGSNDFNIFVGNNATGVTIQGVDTSGNPIMTAPEGASSADAPVIEAAGVYPVFGSSNVFIQADNVTLRGFEINGDPNNVAKSVEIVGNGDTVTDDAFSPSTLYSGAGDLAPSVFHGGTGIYISDFRFDPTGGGTSTVQSYTFTNNTFDGGGKGAGIYIASGAGWTGAASGRVISGNQFSSTDDAIDFAGPTSPIAWLLYPVGAATITGNTFSNTKSRQVLVWGTGGPGVGYVSPNWCGIMSANTFDGGSFIWQGSTVCPGGSARTWAETPGSGGGNYTNVAGLYSTIQQYGIGKSLAGDTVQVLAGTYNEVVTIPHVLTLIGAQAGVDARTRSGSESILTCALCPTPGETPLWVGADDVTVDGFTVAGNTYGPLVGAGVYLEPHTHGTHFVNNIVRNNIIGLMLANDQLSDPTLIQHNLFRDNTNPGSASGNDIYTDEFDAQGAVTGVTIDANKFTNGSFVENGWAVDLSNVGLPLFSNIVVSNNSIDNHGRGVVFYATTNSSITGNTFVPGALNHYGVLLCGNDPSCYTPPYTPPGIADTNISVTLNSLGCASCGGRGVEVLQANASGSGLLINRNDLHGLPIGISSDSASPVDGTCNWWGSASGPGVGQAVGAVVTTPWLTSSALATAPCGPSSPGPPVIGVAAASGFGGVSVTFTAGNNGGSPITSFTVTCVSLAGQVSGSVSGPGSPLVITGLQGGTPYSCSATETNVVGTSGPSGSTEVIFPEASNGAGGVVTGGGSGCTVTPSAPLTPSAASEAFPGAAVSWAPPISGCVAGYVVTPYLGGVAQTPTLIDGSGTTTVIRGLVAGDTYTFTVAAENGLVVGPASVMTPAVTIGVPTSVTAVRVARVGKGSVRVSFAAARGNGAPVKSYAATCASANGGKTRTKAAKTGPLTVTGLTVGKSYTCTVTATNSRGTGRPAKSTPIRA